jgi:hypothetical protein
MTAGARSIFMLPGISKTDSHNKLMQKLGLNLDVVQSLIEHWNIFKNIAKFNKRYPAEVFLIEPDDIERSLEAYAKKRGMTIRGQYIDEKLAPYLMKPTKAVTPLQ